VNDPRIDAERLAKLLGGRLGPRERDELLAYLAFADDDYGLFVEAAAVLRELEVEDGLREDDPEPESPDAAAPGAGEEDPLRGSPEPPDATAGPEPPEAAGPRVPETNGPVRDPKPDSPNAPIPFRPGARGWRRPRARRLLLAAVLALSVLVPAVWWRSRGLPMDDPGRVAALLAARDAGLPPEWARRRPWDGTLGAAGAPPRTAEGRAARLGVFHVDLVLAARARDAARTAQLANGAAELLEEVRGSAIVAAQYREVAARAGSPPAALEEVLDEAGSGAAALLGEQVGLGAWAEAGLIAAARRDAAFFRAPRSRAILERLAKLESLPEPARAAARRVLASNGARGAGVWEVRERDMAALLAALAG